MAIIEPANTVTIAVCHNIGGYGQFKNILSNIAVMTGDVLAINARLYGYVYFALAMLDSARVVATVANSVAYRMRCFH